LGRLFTETNFSTHAQRFAGLLLGLVLDMLRMRCTSPQRSSSENLVSNGGIPAALSPLVIIQKISPSLNSPSVFGSLMSGGFSLSMLAIGPSPLPVSPWHIRQFSSY